MDGISGKDKITLMHGPDKSLRGIDMCGKCEKNESEITERKEDI